MRAGKGFAGRSLMALACAWVMAGLGGCASTDTGLGYYWQSVRGHVGVLQAARPVDDWLADPAVSDRLKTKLRTAQHIRRFASEQLALPDNPSYTRYADLQRRAVVWNVVAAPELSLKLHTWCYPVVGCAGYRGYYDEAQARAFAQGLRDTSDPPLETAVLPVPAYSTLGWLNVLGGDPLLSTFLGYPDGELARLIFHELSHQVLYIADDTTFNESFATAVEEIGGDLWLAQAGDTVRTEYQQFNERRRAFRALALQTRQSLDAIYRHEGMDDKAKRAAKEHSLATFRDNYAQLKTSWGGWAGYDGWVNQIGNALLGTQAAYDDWVPAFKALFVQQGGDWQRFYAAARELSAQARPEREARLLSLAPRTTRSNTP
jgi:predicted aminopeptidase